MNALQLLLLCLSVWLNRNQQLVINYLQKEVKVLRGQPGKKPRFNDDQRRRLATKAKKLGLSTVYVSLPPSSAPKPFWTGTIAWSPANTTAVRGVLMDGHPRRRSPGD